jgi:hypothetical protein
MTGAIITKPPSLLINSIFRNIHSIRANRPQLSKGSVPNTTAPP